MRHYAGRLLLGAILALVGSSASAQTPAVTVSFGSATYAVTEGWTVDVVVTLDADPERTVTIPVEASPEASGDYSIPGSVTFYAGETQKPVNFVTVDDLVVESEETFGLSFGSALPTGVSLGSRTTSQVRIADDDGPETGRLELRALAVTGGVGSMYPVFNPRVHHYAIRCPDATTLRVTATAPDASHQLTLNKIPVPGMELDKNVVVDSDQDTAVELSDGGESVLYVVHCIPQNFPNIKITKKQAGVSDGLLLFAPSRNVFPRSPAFIAIMDNNGVPRFARDALGESPLNFRRHTTDIEIDGRQVHYSVTHRLGTSFDGRHSLLDASFNVIRTVGTELADHTASLHDFLITEEETFLFFSHGTVTRNVGGVETETVENVIEEVSPTGERLWSWNSWDHLKIDPDCLGYIYGLRSDPAITAHINALTLIDGDVVASSRGCAQVVRISRSEKSETDEGTDLLWQLGGTDPGTVSSDGRTFVAISGDENGLNEFCRQHHATETASGTVVLFDNGVNCLSGKKREPEFSRAVEYEIDLGAGEARFLREVRLDRRYGYAPFTGSVDILENGHWLISWGYLRYADSSLSVEDYSIAISEVDVSGTELLQVKTWEWEGTSRVSSFRVYRESEADVEIRLNLPVTLMSTDAQASESAGEMVFEVELSVESSEEVTVDYATANGTARAGQDYEARSGTLTFPADSTTPEEIRVPILNDDRDEAEVETFTVRLRNATNATLAGGGTTLTVTGTITDDDEPVAPPPPPPPPPDPGPDPDPDPDPDPGPDPGPPKADFTVDAECADGLCRTRTGAAVSFEDTSSGSVQRRSWEFGDGAGSRSASPRYAWSAPGFYTVTLVVSSGDRESSASRVFLVEASDPAGTCRSDVETMCLQDSRFAVTVDWWLRDGSTGSGRVVREGTNDSGLFQFFDADNWEVLIKVLDGCAINGHVWVFGASTTDIGYAIRVRDTATGAVREYRNEPGRPAPAITDGTAFPDGCRP